MAAVVLQRRQSQRRPRAACEAVGLLYATQTWNTDADEYRSGTAWDDVIDDIKGTDLSGKTVAVFGCGDQEGYGDNFTDGIEELHETFKAAGAKMVGYVDAG